ncbi:MAG: hypothetical protein ACE5IP_03735 [Terriglobia bacterium]
MQILLLTLAGLLLLAVIGAVVLYFYLKNYLKRSQEGAQGTMSEIAEEIDSYREKTQ